MGLTTKGVTGYNVKTKEKNVLMKDVKINVKSGKFIAIGTSSKKDKTGMSAIMGRADAEKAIQKGFAEQGEGWDALED